MTSFCGLTTEDRQAVLLSVQFAAPEARMWRVVVVSVVVAFAALAVSEFLRRRGRRHEVI